MKNYKVEYDKETSKIIVRWFDDYGNEVDGDEGTYRIKIPANTFIVYGDGVNCDCNGGNDEWIYTFTIAGKAPKPIIATKFADNRIYFIVDNSAISSNYKDLGYKTYNKMFEQSIMFDTAVSHGDIQYDPEADLSKFGYTENKAVIYFDVDGTTQVDEGKEYTCTLVEDSVANAGFGDLYNQNESYNDDTSLVIIGTPKPVVSVKSFEYDKVSQKLTAIYTVSNDNLNDDADKKFSTSIDNSHKPIIVSKNNSTTAYCESVEVNPLNKEEYTCIFTIKRPDDFWVLENKIQYFYFNSIVDNGWFVNKGDGTNLFGFNYSDGIQVSTKVQKIERVPTPYVTAINKQPNVVATAWNDINGDTYTTTTGTVSFIATMNDGTTVDLSSYSTLVNSGNTSSFWMNVVNNFNLDPDDVDTFKVTFNNGFYTNSGDNLSTSGVEYSMEYSFLYQPVDCRIELDYVKTNVNPFYPIIDGKKLSAEHDGEITTFADGCLQVVDNNNNILMSWDSSKYFNKIDYLTKHNTSKRSDVGKYSDDLNESINSEDINRFTIDDDVYYEMDDMYSTSGNYENYFGNQIIIKADPSQMYIIGDGQSKLGELSGKTNTESISRYVLELELNDVQEVESDGKVYSTRNIITGNTFGSLVDWNTDAFSTLTSVPEYVGCKKWCCQNETEGIAYNNGSLKYISTLKNLNFAYAYSYFWAQNLYEKSEDENFRQILKSYQNNFKDLVENKLEFKDNFEEWITSYFNLNPITFTGTTEAEKLNPQSYTHYYPSLTDDEKEGLFDEYSEYWTSIYVNNKFNLYNYNTDTSHTYSFLYEKKAKMWRFGVHARPYNSEGVNLVAPITKILKIDTSNQTDFSYFMYNQSSLNAVKANIDLGNAQNCSYMFAGCFLDNNNYWNKSWDGSINTSSDMNSVLSAESMYDGCLSITGMPVSFQFANLLYANRMFYDCRNLRQLHSKFNPVNIQDASEMFAVEGVNLPEGTHYYDVNGNYVTYYKGYLDKDETMFKYFDTENQTLQMEKNDNTIEVYAESAFTMTSIPSTWNSVSNIYIANGMFRNRKLLTSLPSIWNFSSLSYASEMFSNCSNLLNLPNGWINTSNLTVANNMFENCASMKFENSGFKCQNMTDARGMFAGTTMQYLNDTFQPNKLQNASNMFAFNEYFKQIPAMWTSVDYVNDASSMFCGCSSLTAIPSTWNFYNTEDSTAMFYGCTSMISVSSEFDKLSSFLHMFVESNITGNTSIMDIGNLKDETNDNYTFLGSNMYYFRIVNFGKTENLRKNSSIEAEPIIISLRNLNVPSTDIDKNNLATSLLYLVDNVWTGETIGNSKSYSDHRSLTSDRSVWGNGCYIDIEKDVWNSVKDLIKERYGSCSKFAQDVFADRLNATTDDYVATHDYKITWLNIKS